LVWNGPLTTSAAANWISVHELPRWARNFAQLFAADVCCWDVGYASGSSVSKWVK
jgi:hypothetical protein